MTEDRAPRTGITADRPHTIACLSASPWNPYLRLLHEHLAVHDFEVVDDWRLGLRSLWRDRQRIGFLYFHWPEGQYRHQRGPDPLRPFLSRLKLVLFAARLLAAHAFGYRLVWTIHQVLPHERSGSGLDLHAARLLARVSDLLVAHDQATASQARTDLGIDSKPLVVVPHGSYIGVYPASRTRQDVRADLGVPEDSFVFLCFGELRAYKEIELLLDAFMSTSLPQARLIVAGHAKDPDVASAVRIASEQDPRITALFGFLPTGRVGDLFVAADVAVLPRGSTGTSGSLILALSLGTPVIAADLPTNRELMPDGKAGWFFRPGDAQSLHDVLVDAAGDPPEARTRGQQALELAANLRWTETAGTLAAALERLGP